jgi:predicted MPP superfamily phosphohydrolase
MGLEATPGLRSLRNWAWSAGLHCIQNLTESRGWNQLYVNRGIASHLLLGVPLRLFCPPEITLLTLKRQKSCL